MDMEIELILDLGSGGPRPVRVRRLVVAGWTGRDRAAVERHIEELRSHGVTPPTRVPTLYRATLDRLTTADRVQVLGERTSGEAEPVLLVSGGAVWAGVGSDHTDRQLETLSVEDSKQACPKVVGRTFWRLDDLAGRWDGLALRSWSDGQPYQEGRAGELLPPDELLRLVGPEDGTLIMMGTIATRDGLRFGRRFEAELDDGGRAIRCAYEVEAVPRGA
jgi:hypothetical protein